MSKNPSNYVLLDVDGKRSDSALQGAAEGHEWPIGASRTAKTDHEAAMIRSAVLALLNEEGEACGKSFVDADLALSAHYETEVEEGVVFSVSGKAGPSFHFDAAIEKLPAAREHPHTLPSASREEHDVLRSFEPVSVTPPVCAAPGGDTTVSSLLQRSRYAKGHVPENRDYGTALFSLGQLVRVGYTWSAYMY